MKLSIVILAAGQGTRMRSALPKVVHPLAGRPLLRHVIDTARTLAPEAIHVVYGHGGEQVRECIDDIDLSWIRQQQQRGTGDAVAQAMPAIPDHHQVLVLCGDVPLVRPDTLQRLCAAAADGGALLIAVPEDPAGYGRILRDAAGDVAGIVEEKDASEAQRRIGEINTGLMCLPAGPLRGWLAGLSSDNAQGELYLTDVIAMARRDGVGIAAVTSPTSVEVQGVNDRAQLATLERAFQHRAATDLMRQGVSLADPSRFDLRGRLFCGRDVWIDINAVFHGDVELADNVQIGPNCVIADSRIGAGTTIEANSVLEGVLVEGQCRIGPFARLRPGTRLAQGARIGNFVETKAAAVGAGSKINHLSYVGDAEIGRGVNIGAGTITCNYDGVRKHSSIIEDDAFIGSNTALVAPVRVGRGATVGAGTTLRKTAPADALTLTGSRQKTVTGWSRRRRESDD